ncbi:MAG: Guanylate kinase [Chlamydiia bacterium]|nr:Guanylate kinase [Chlamydiia bacterium]
MGLNGKIDKGLVIVVSAPAGTGKTTLAEMLTKKYPSDIVRSISCTTRSPRGDEVDGKDYIYLSKEDFLKKVDSEEFLENAKVFDNYYGTLKKSVQDLQLQGKHVILVIDTQGAMKIKEKTSAVLVFIKPPSIEALKERLDKRHTDTEENISLRLSWAKEEMKKGEHYDVTIVNDDLQKAFDELECFIKKKESELCSYT